MMNKNQLLVLNELKEKFGEEYIFDDVAYFADKYRHDDIESEVSQAYLSLSKKEEIEVLEEYIKHLKRGWKQYV